MDYSTNEHKNTMLDVTFEKNNKNKIESLKKTITIQYKF